MRLDGASGLSFFYLFLFPFYNLCDGYFIIIPVYVKVLILIDKNFNYFLYLMHDNFKFCFANIHQIKVKSICNSFFKLHIKQYSICLLSELIIELKSIFII